MSDEDYSTIYDRVQKERVYENTEQPAENGGPLYDAIHEESRAEDKVYATELETHEYDFVAVYQVGRKESSSASFQPEVGEYLLPDEVYPEAQDLQPHEAQDDRSTWVGELFSPTQDQQAGLEQPQENGSEMEEAQPSPSSFSTRHSRALSPSEGFPAHSSAAAVSEEKEPTSTSPEISLFVKLCGVGAGTPELDRARHRPSRFVAGVLGSFFFWAVWV